MAKKEELKLEIPLDGTKPKLQLARVLLQEKNLKKTGKNKFANFDFFQLKDFMPDVNEIFAKLGLYSEFSVSPIVVDYEETTTTTANGDVKIAKKPIIKEIAILTICDTTKPLDIVEYNMEASPVMIGNNSKQNLYQAAGGRQTYYKRYLYMNALEIVEDDESDAVLGQEDVNYQQPQITQGFQMPNIVGQTLNNMTQQPAQQFVANNITAPIQGEGTWESQDVKPVNQQTTPKETVQDTSDKVVNKPLSKEIKNEPLSQEAKMEIMNLVNAKGINGAKLIGEFCKEHGLENTNDLLEIHKPELIEMVNNYSE